MRRFATSNLAMANYYHRGHIKHCQEQIEKAKKLSKSLKLKIKWNIKPSSYIDAMEKYIVYSDIEEENEQRASAIDWEIIGIFENNKYTKKRRKEIEELNKKREIYTEKRNNARKEISKIEDYLNKFGLSFSQII